jgi:hypothetical protein
MTSSDDHPHDLTPWLAGSTTPVHVGPYKRRFPAGPYSCWNGMQWLGDSATVAGAAGSETTSRFQSVAWRGLATPAETPCPTCGGHGVLDDGSAEGADGFPPLHPCPDC